MNDQPGNEGPRGPLRPSSDPNQPTYNYPYPPYDSLPSYAPPNGQYSFPYPNGDPQPSIMVYGPPGSAPHYPHFAGSGMDPHENGHPHPHQHQEYIDPSRVGSVQQRQEQDRQKKRRKTGTGGTGERRGSEIEQVEAGLALAGMGMGLSPQQMQERAKAESTPPGGGETRKRTKSDKKTDDKSKNGGGNGGGGQARRSCAECRRIKAKCSILQDGVFPCSNCRKRGCAVVCPDGDLGCMQGKRLVLKDTEQLHERIAQLESALSQAHRATSSGTHPLLLADYLDGGKATKPGPTQSPSGNLSDNSPRIDGLSPGQGSSHDSTILRTPADRRMAVESLLIGQDNVDKGDKGHGEWVGENAAPALIVACKAPTVADTPSDRQRTVERLRAILRILPPREQTRKQANRFWKFSTWFQHMLRKEEFEAIYEPSVYAPTPANPLTPHKLACVLLVLTLDTFFDLEGDEDNPLIAEYWEGVQNCFDTRFGWAASTAGVQALGLATFFVGFGWRGVGSSNFYWLRQMTWAVQQLGLHKEPHPSLPPHEALFRRRVFWESYSIDCLMSINFSIHTAIPHEAIEAKYPDEDTPLPQLKYDYMTRVKSRVIQVGSKQDKASVEEMEREVDEVAEVLMRYDIGCTPEPFPAVLRGEPDPDTVLSPAEIDVNEVTRCTTSMCHYKAMLFLFRPSLRRLITRIRATDTPDDPSSQSQPRITLTPHEKKTVEMTFHACRSVIAVSAFLARTHPRLTSRTWSTWVQTFSAAVSLAALAIWCAPFLEDKDFAKRAYQEIRMGCGMIKAHGCQRARGVQALLPILYNLVENRHPELRAPGSPPAIVSDGEDMLYALLGGQVMPRKSPSGTQTPISTATATSAANGRTGISAAASASIARRLTGNYHSNGHASQKSLNGWGSPSMPIPDVPLAPATSAAQAAASARAMIPHFDATLRASGPMNGLVTDDYGRHVVQSTSQSTAQWENGVNAYDGDGVGIGRDGSHPLSSRVADTGSGHGSGLGGAAHTIPKQDQPPPPPHQTSHSHSVPQSQTHSNGEINGETNTSTNLDHLSNGAPVPAPVAQFDPMEVWNRLQTFYEPAVPLFHPGGGGGMATLMGAGGFGFGLEYGAGFMNVPDLTLGQGQGQGGYDLGYGYDFGLDQYGAVWTGDGGGGGGGSGGGGGGGGGGVGVGVGASVVDGLQYGM